MTDSLKHECGVFGVFGHKESANLTYLGLHALQHRGQESAGIATLHEGTMRVHRSMGLVADVFDADMLSKLKGDKAIGHVRYSTTGASILKNAQPFTVETRRGSMAIAHNGNLVNGEQLRNDLEDQGVLFYTTTDTEIIAHLLARSKAKTIEDRLADIMPKLKGAYSLLILFNDTMIAARDPRGYRPLVLGRRGTGYVVSSESSSLNLIEASYVREIEPGEVAVINEKGLHSSFPEGETATEKKQECIFELIYFARPDSHVFDRSVYSVRKALGKGLAQEKPAPTADLVVPVPDSGVGAALGFARESGTPFEMGLMRSHYVGRTFIEPSQSIRHFGVRLKLSPVRDMIKGKSLVVVDDSLVRATTSRKIVAMLRAAGAVEVHVRISCPPILWPCYYGIDTPERSQLIAASHSVEEIARFINADSLGYLSLKGMFQAAGNTGEGFCDACFSGNYAIPPVPGLTAPPPSLVET